MFLIFDINLGKLPLSSTRVHLIRKDSEFRLTYTSGKVIMSRGVEAKSLWWAGDFEGLPVPAIQAILKMTKKADRFLAKIGAEKA